MKKYKLIFARTRELRQEAYKFYSKGILKEYGNMPEPLDENMQILAIISDKKIIACIGLYFKTEGMLFPYEKIYKIEANSRLLLPVNETSFVSRWVSGENKFGMLISYYASLHIQKMNRKFAACILKLHVARYLNRISGNIWNLLPNAVLQLGNVPNEDRIYFESHPSPEIYYCDNNKYIIFLKKNCELMLHDVSTEII